jgi:sodium-independent sulfate anion transporter 11
VGYIISWLKNRFLITLKITGFLVQFIASPVVAGFSSAAAITIASSQLKSLFGITSGSSNEFLPSWQNFFAHLNEIRLWDTVLGISSIIILILLKNLTRLDRWKSTTKYISNSRNAIIVIAGIILAFVLDQNGLEPFKVTGNITPGIPNIILPPFSTSFGGKEYNFLEMVQELGTSLITIPLVLVLELIAIAKAFSKGKIVDATQEMIALGLCNIFGSFAQSIPVTGL